ncbi:MAG: cytochrome C, partial [Candidatus Methanomethylicota archaeon]
MTVKELMLDPITRLEGHAALHAKIDVESKKYVDAHSIAGMFRGFEIILKGRDPPDASFITQRICGVCPVPHAYASVLSLDMALKASPPPLAIILRNLTIAAELLYDHPIHLFQLAGPDYSAVIVKKFNKAWWSAAQLTLCEYRDVHGYATVADLMEALNPLSGGLYLYTLKMERFSRRLASLLGAKHPHVNTFIPGGVARTWGATEAAQAFSMLLTLAGLSKLLVAVWEDLSRFLYDMGYEDAGLRPANLIAYGVMENHESYDASYANMSKWGEDKYMTPGVVINGDLATYDLKEIHRGIR